MSDWRLTYSAIGLVAFVAGLIIAIGFGLQLTVFAVAGYSITLIAIARFHGYLKEGGDFLVLLAVTAIPATVLTTFVSRQYSIIADVWVILAATAGLRLILGPVGKLTVTRALSALFALYLCFGLASSIFGDTVFEASAYQFAYNLKLPAMLLAGTCAGWSARRERILGYVLTIGLVTSLVFVGFELIFPAVYRSAAIGTLANSVTPNPLLRGVIPGTSGPFVHSGMLSVSASFMGAAFFVFLVTATGRLYRDICGFTASTLIVVLAGQQQEAFSYVLVLVLVGVLARTKPSVGAVIKVLFVGLVVGSGLIFALGEQQLDKLEKQWGLVSTTERISSARPVFSRDGIELANSAFPIGTGLGTFGSVGAQSFDRALYTKLGYDSYWWYRQNIFLLDTYWPNIIAESGWLGGAVLALFLLTALFAMSWRYWIEVDVQNKRLFGLATAGQFIVLATSITSPIYSNPSSCVWLLVWTGMAIRCMATSAEWKRNPSAGPSFRRTSSAVDRFGVPG